MSGEQPCACFRCGYDLSGQVASWSDCCPLEGTCPECGLVFRWEEAITPARVGPNWSVEHASNAGLAMVAGLIRACTPWRLWGARRGRLSMEVPLHPERLWAALAVLAIFGWLLIGLVNVWMSIAIEATHPSTRTNTDLLTTLLHPERPVAAVTAPLIYYRFAPTLFGIAALPLAFATLTQSLSRKRIRRAHLLRIAVYSLGPVLPAVALMVLTRAFATAGAWGMLGRPIWMRGIPTRLTVWTVYLDDRPYLWAIALGAWMFLYWRLAFKRYLRLADATLTALLIVVATALVSTLVVGFWPGSPLLTEIDAFFRGWV